MTDLRALFKHDVPPALRAHSDRAAHIAQEILKPQASMVDAESKWPAHAMEALGSSGLLGLHVPKSLGGLGEGLHALALITEELGAGCASSAMCYGMHCVATKVLASKATEHQEKRYLRPIAEGRHVTSLALSEPGTGAHFYIPQTTFAQQGAGFVLRGTKSFVTSGGHADSYVVSAVGSGAEHDPRTFSCFIVDLDSVAEDWEGEWDGFGLRGNSSRNLRLDGTEVPERNLLGREGDELEYVFEVIAPYFLVSMSGIYIGVARSALDEAIEGLRGRRYAHSAQSLAESPVLASEIAQSWTEVSRARQLLHHAARLHDTGSAGALEAVLACKAEIAEMVVRVTNTAMTLGGGRAYGANARLARLMRDARAAHVMAPTTQMLRIWLGRGLLGLPLF